MKPVRLIISAWGPYADKETVDFTKMQQGEMFLITGPTGSGKTTIFDAITYAIYGMVSGKTRDKNSVRSDFAKEEMDTYVELEFMHKGKAYMVRRSPRYSRRKKRGEGFITNNETAELYEDGKVPHTIVKDVNIRLREIMGFSYEQYKQIAMIAQGEFMELLLASSKERVEIFRNLFKTECYERIQKGLTEKTKHLYMEIQEIYHRMEEAISMIDTNGEDELCELLKSDYLNYLKITENLQRMTELDKNRISQLLKEVEECSQSIKKIISKGEIYFNLRKRMDTLLEEIEEYMRKQKKAEDNLSIILERKEKQEREWKEEDLVFERKEKAEKKEMEELLKEAKKFDSLEREEGELILFLEKVKNEKEGLLRLVEKKSALLKQVEALNREQKLYQEAAVLTKKRKSEYEEKEEIYKAAAIGLVARFVEEGKPCPVCGALEHPQVAGLSEEVPDEKEVKRWKEKWEKEEEKLELIYKKATQEKGILLAMEQELKESFEALAVTEEALPEVITENNKKEEMLIEKRRVLDGKKVEKKREEAKKNELEKEIEKRGKEIEKVINLRKKEIEKQTEQENRYRLETERAKAVIKEKKIDAEKIKKEEEKLREKIEVETLQEELKSLEEKEKMLQREKECVLTRRNINKKAEISIREKMEDLKEKEEVYGIYRDLDNVCRGNNKDRTVFEHYVLAAYFEDVLAAANLRLTDMTVGRYELMKIDKVADGRTTDSLELEVLDNYTGKRRSVKTLSGGESFKAALSMALGLSDIVQSTKGGIWIDTLFIDEGFGSLDEESLDQALISLRKLTGQNQMIGIISHVNELKERIDRQIVIKKESNGSTILNT